METVNAIRMTFEDYKDVVSKATDNKVSLRVVDGEWDYLCEADYEYDFAEIHKLVSNYLKIEISDVLIDISNDGANVIIV
jgi:hypothetical protein